MEHERPEYVTRLQSWERKTPWFRRISARTGLQGKLVLSFMFLLLATLLASSFQYVSESRQVAQASQSAKATAIATTAAVGAEAAIRDGDQAELSAMGKKML